MKETDAGAILPGVLVLRAQIPVVLGCIQKSLCTDDIGGPENLRLHSAVIYMVLRRKVNHGVKVVFGKQLFHQNLVPNGSGQKARTNVEKTLWRVPKVLASVFFYKERALAASKMLEIHTVYPALFSLQSLPPCEKSRFPDFRDTP